jgi:hypothetical protein
MELPWSLSLPSGSVKNLERDGQAPGLAGRR